MSSAVKKSFKASVGNVSFDVELGTSLLDAAKAAGLVIHHTCGGHGHCLTCRFTLLEGELTPPSKTEARQSDLLQGMRQACQCGLLADSRLLFACLVYSESGQEIVGSSPEI